MTNKSMIAGARAGLLLWVSLPIISALLVAGCGRGGGSSSGSAPPQNLQSSSSSSAPPPQNLQSVPDSQLTIDTSSEQAMQTTITKVRESLSQAKREEFDNALQLIVFSQIDFGTDSASDANAAADRMKSKLSGKTGEQVIAEGENIEEVRRTKERDQALAEIKELQEKKAKWESAKVELARFQVERSRFFKKKQKYYGEQPIIELTVRNGTAHPVSRAFFVGTLRSPNRAVPWMKDDFNYSISGGLEPGEAANWSLAPNQFGDWGTVNAPDDAVFTVEVVRLDGADGETLFSSREFTDEDEKRLKKLLSQFPESAR
jgi:hypothetical protein